MITVLDNIDHDFDLSNFKKWYSGRVYSLSDCNERSDFITKLLSIASSYFNLDSCTGYESWTQLNDRPGGWHVDLDEARKISDGIIRLPICSIIYYLKIDNVIGGQLKISHRTVKDGIQESEYIKGIELSKVEPYDVITPKTNRLVMIPPGIYHKVETFKGERMSMIVNPWNTSKFMNLQ